MQVLALACCHGATVIGSLVLKDDANSSVSTTTITSSVTIDRATVEACKVTGREQHVTYAPQPASSPALGDRVTHFSRGDA